MEGKTMATIMPKSENLRQAVKWISAILKEEDENGIAVLIQKAALRFNLSPREEDFLRSFYQEDSNN